VSLTSDPRVTIFGQILNVAQQKGADPMKLPRHATVALFAATMSFVASGCGDKGTVNPAPATPAKLEGSVTLSSPAGDPSTPIEVHAFVRNTGGSPLRYLWDCSGLPLRAVGPQGESVAPWGWRGIPTCVPPGLNEADLPPGAERTINVSFRGYLADSRTVMRAAPPGSYRVALHFSAWSVADPTDTLTVDQQASFVWNAGH
jgi:hypothetical protein